MASGEPQYQTREQKLGEVRLRRDTAAEQLYGAPSSEEEFTCQDLIANLEGTIQRTLDDFRRLDLEDEAAQPFIEIGAQRAQRAAALISQFGLQGVATDLSPHSLLTTERLADYLDFSALPPRVCCDAYALPFAFESFAFAFCYQTLHHFPDPTPIIGEIHRVLCPGGSFYFGEEPLHRLLKLQLFRVAHKLSPTQKLLRKLKILPLIASGGKREISYGIVEAEHRIGKWLQALGEYFSQFTLWARFRGLGRVRLGPADLQRLSLRKLLAAMLGGSVEAVAHKKGARPPTSAAPHDLFEFLICPDCLHQRGDTVRVERQEEAYLCPRCGRRLRFYRGLLMALPQELEEAIAEYLSPR